MEIQESGFARSCWLQARWLIRSLGRRTVTLTDEPVWMLLVQIICSFLAQRCCTGENELDRTKIEFVKHGLVLRHQNDDWRNQVQGANFIVLNGLEEQFELKLWQDNNAVTTIDAGVVDDHKRVDVTEWQQTELILQVLLFSWRFDNVAERF